MKGNEVLWGKELKNVSSERIQSERIFLRSKWLLFHETERVK